jgi:hypothetical protein
MSVLSKFQFVEPLKENRFLINIIGTTIPNLLFRKFEIHNEGNELIFTTSFYETVQFSFNPTEFFNITGVVIDYLDPTGTVVNSLIFDVKGSNYGRKQSYSNDELQINELKFIVKKETMNLLYENKI